MMTIIGASLVITGEMTSQEEITVHGQIRGQIRTEATLLVAPSAKVDADVHGTSVTIHGTLAGNVAATQRIELTPTADVTGTLMTPAVVLREGAAFNGTLDMERKTGKAGSKASEKPSEQAAKTA